MDLLELEWIIDSFSAFPILVKKMFGARAIYLNEKMILLLSEGKKESQWNGALFPVEREVHQIILQRYPYLTPHSILGKWLYLPLQIENFEELINPILREMRSEKYEWGIIPKPKKKPTKKKKGILNIGPKSLKILNQIKVTNETELKKMGWQKASEKLSKLKISIINLNFTYALMAACKNKDWRELTEKEKALCKNWNQKLKSKKKIDRH